jgi:hypothetical protein
MWFHLIPRWLRDPRAPGGRVAERPEAVRAPRSVRMSLEELEPRVVLSTTDATPPPSFQQAAVALYIGGFELGFAQFSQLAMQSLQPSIAFYSPYAEPFAQLLVLAGANAGTDALNQFTSTFGPGAIDLLP